MDIGEVSEISSHALERFKERWEILDGKPLEEGNVLSKLQAIIVSAKPEPESPTLIKRNERYGGKSRYMVHGPWRLVWQGNRLETVELRNQGLLTKPKLYRGEIRTQFYLRIIEGAETWIDKAATAGFSKIETLSLRDQPEVNAIIRFLRLIGIDVAYKRVGTESRKEAILNILLPKSFRQWQIEKIVGRKIWLKFPNHVGIFLIAGIGEEDCRRILSFVADEAWIQDKEAVRERIREEQIKLVQEREEEKRRKHQERQRIQIEEKLRLAAEKKKRREAKEEEYKSKAIDRARAFDRLLAETLDISTDPYIVLREFIKRFPQKIQTDEHKLGKTWLINYRFAAGPIQALIIIRDAPTREIGRKEAAKQIVSKLKSLLKPAP